jgi:carbamoyltransferase
MASRIVGFNLSHDSSACLVEDGRIRAALALERTTRVKRGVVPAHAYAAAMADLTQQLLAGMDLTYSDVDYWIATSTESRDEHDEKRLASALGLLVPPDRCLSLPHPGHHLAHASAAFYSSGFDAAAAIVVDAYGSRAGGSREQETAFAFSASGAPRRVLQVLRGDDRIAGRMRDGSWWLPGTLSGIGEMYRVITLALGFSEPGTTYDDAGKTMGLAAYGHRLSGESLFIQVRPAGLSFDGAGDALVELGLAVRASDGLRLCPRPPGAPLRQFHRDLAAQIQSEFEEACLYLTRDVLARTGSRLLAVAGGCFLNSVVNARILRETDTDRLFVFPAATDDGNAAGAALYAHHVLINAGAGRSPSPAGPLADVYLGPPRLAGYDVGALADRWGLPVRRHAKPGSLSAAAAAAIARGEIVGWFQNRAEFGPRSLGARSILCHPGLSGMKDRLNARVKFREPFRPFAASVLAEHAAKWFDLPAADSPFMLLVCPVLPAQQEAISEVVHADGTCRIQTVDQDLPGPFRALLEAFEDETGLPMVLNTSFNLRGLPIVELPEEAIDCLYGSRLDRLFIGEYEIAGPDLAALRPVRTLPDVQLIPRPAAAQRVPDDPVTAAATDGAAGFRQQPAAGACPGLLDRATGTQAVREIAAELGLDEDLAVDCALELRRQGLVRWAGIPPLPTQAFPLPQYDPQTETA